MDLDNYKEHLGQYIWHINRRLNIGAISTSKHNKLFEKIQQWFDHACELTYPNETSVEV